MTFLLIVIGVLVVLLAALVAGLCKAAKAGDVIERNWKDQIEAYERMWGRAGR